MAHKSDPADDYDLLTVLGMKAEHCKVAFDVYTPRPHFIFLPKPGDSSRDSFLTDMFEAGLKLQGKLQLNQATLALHLGKWATPSEKLLGHLVTDPESYLAVFHKYSKKSPMRDWWPDERYRTHQWRKTYSGMGNLQQAYDGTVMAYPLDSYKEAEMRDVKKMIQRGTPVKSLVLPHGLSAVFHQEQPRIGIISDQRDDISGQMASLSLTGAASADPTGRKKSGYSNTPTNLASSLQKVAEQNSFSGKDKWGGCHICVDISGKGYCGFVDDQKRIVTGYVQVSAQKYYEVCPAALRDSWFKGYEKWDGKVYT